MPLFKSEQDMQDWLSNELDAAQGLAELIVHTEEIEETPPSNAAEARVLKSFSTSLNSLYINRKLSEDENIAANPEEILKPDFLLYAVETESIVVVELKNLVTPARQAGTELAAYTSAVRNRIPLLSEGDVVHVLISTTWPTLLLHYARDQILWQGKNLICLEPVSDEAGEIKLKILSVKRIMADIDADGLTSSHLGGYQLCLYPISYKANEPLPDFTAHLEQFKTALQAMANEGNRLKSHGFAYLWKDHLPHTMAPYSIAMMNIAPFRLDKKPSSQAPSKPPLAKDWFAELLHDNSPSGHGQALNSVREVACSMLRSVCDPRAEGFAQWDDHKFMMGDRAEKLAFVGWGLFGETLFDKLLAEYKAGKTSHHLMSVELGNWVIDQLVQSSNRNSALFDTYADVEEGKRRQEYLSDPPTKCGYCSSAFEKEKYFADAQSASGRWGFMCADCFVANSAEIKVGRGQLFLNMQDGNWLLVGGFLDEK